MLNRFRENKSRAGPDSAGTDEPEKFSAVYL
jgi:hypothetical protein